MSVFLTGLRGRMSDKQLVVNAVHGLGAVAALLVGLQSKDLSAPMDVLAVVLGILGAGYRPTPALVPAVVPVAVAPPTVPAPEPPAMIVPQDVGWRLGTVAPPNRPAPGYVD